MKLFDENVLSFSALLFLFTQNNGKRLVQTKRNRVHIPELLKCFKQGFHFIFHFLVAQNPDDGDDCQCTEPCQGEEKYVVSCKHAHKESNYGEEEKGKEPS